MSHRMTDLQRGAAERTVSLFAACEQTGAVDAPHPGSRTLVAAGGHRFEVPATATDSTVSIVRSRLAGIFGACYVESDGKPSLGVTLGVPETDTDRPSAGASVAAILAARRAAASNT